MKIQSPWMGRVRGSAGNMTGSKVYDKNVLRAKAFEVSNPNTTAQQTERSFFAEVAEFCSTFSEAQLRTLFPTKPKSMSRRNALTKQMTAFSETSNGVKSLSYEYINTLGNAPTSNLLRNDCTIGQTYTEVELDISKEMESQYAFNHFIVAIINDTQKQMLFTTKSSVVGTAVISLHTPSNWQTTDAAHAIALITDSKEELTNKDFGSFFVILRPL